MRTLTSFTAGAVTALAGVAALAVVGTSLGVHNWQVSVDAGGLVDPVGSMPSISDAFTRYPTTKLSDGATFGPWSVVFAGYGYVRVANGRLQLSPQTATNPAVTHSALVISKHSLTSKCVKVNTRWRTTRQLRTGGTPNPWETGWLIWDYTDNDHFSYLALKSNGWELGKRDPMYPGGQRFLATGATPATAIGTWRNVRIKRVVATGKSTIKVSVGAKPVAAFVDTERPYAAGKVGFYVEDALAEWKSLQAKPC